MRHLPGAEKNNFLIRDIDDATRILLPPSERGPSAPVPSIADENWAGVDIMYYMDGRWQILSLVYFGKP